MRIGDLLYFAPGIRFDQVDLVGPELPSQFRHRITGFYIDPAEACANLGHAFAAGVLLVSAIDALARIRFRGGVGARFRRFAREELQSFPDDDLAERFYDEFRNGLVHEARLKNGGQFSLGVAETVVLLGGLLLINPRCLADEVRTALDSYIALLQHDAGELGKLATRLKQDLAEDLRAARE